MEKQYQLCGRLTGMCRGWNTPGVGDERTTYSRTRVFCPVSVKNVFCQMEKEVVREMTRAVEEERPRLGREGRPR